MRAYLKAEDIHLKISLVPVFYSSPLSAGTEDMENRN